MIPAKTILYEFGYIKNISGNDLRSYTYKCIKNNIGVKLAYNELVFQGFAVKSLESLKAYSRYYIEMLLNS